MVIIVYYTFSRLIRFCIPSKELILFLDKSRAFNPVNCINEDPKFSMLNR